MSAERRSYNERNIAEFRANGGKIPAFGDVPVLTLRRGEPVERPA